MTASRWHLPSRARSRSSATGSCDDGVDDDWDGRTDYPSDPGCAGPVSPREDPGCQDGLDNDRQPGVDFDGGASLDLDHDGHIDAEFDAATPPVGAADPQCLGAPWRLQERSGCGLCFELAPLAALLARRRRRAQTARRANDRVG